MANRVVAVALRAEIGQYVAGMTRAAASTTALGQSSEDMARRTRGSFDVMGKVSQYAGLAVGAALVGIIAKASEFESAMSGVAAATGASVSALGDLREEAMRAGAATQYSATEAADAITEMSKAGISAADIMGGGLDGALSLAAAGQLAVADAAGIASVAMTQFSLSGEDIPHVADLLAAGAGKALGSVDDLGQALNQAGLVASAAGLSIEETTGGLAAFASAGLLGSDAGTSFKSMLQAIQGPSGVAAERMAELGINMYDANGDMLGLSEMAGVLQSQLGGLTEEQRNSALATIFGSDAVRAANVLYREGEAGINRWTAAVDDQGYAADQAARLNDNLRGDLEKLGGAFDTLLIQIGSGAQGPLRELTQGLTGILDVAGGVVGFFTDLPGAAQLALAAFAGWAVVGDTVTSALEPLREGASGFLGTFTEALGFARENGDGLGEVLGSVGEVAWDSARGGLKALAKAIGPELAAAAATYVITDIIGDIVAMANVGDDARKSVDDFRASLVDLDNAGRLTTANTGLEGLRTQLRDAQRIVDDFDNENYLYQITIGQFTGPDADEIRNARAAVDEYTAAIAEQETAEARAAESTAYLSRRYDLTTDQVRELADANGIDLSGSLGVVQDLMSDAAERAGNLASGMSDVSSATFTGTENLASYATAMGMSDDALEELRKHTDELGEGLSQFAVPLSTYTGLIDSKKEAEKQSAQATADATESQSDSWEDYVGDVTVSIDEYLTQLEEQVAAQDAWQLNMLTLAGRVSQGTLDELARMGPEGAPLVADLVNASDSELARLETVFGQRSADAASEFGEQLFLAQPVLNAIAATAGQGVADSLAQQLAAGTVTVAQIARQYGVVLAEGVNPVLASLGRQSINLVQSSLGFGALNRAQGGPVWGAGTATSDSIPAMLSNGEFVVRAASVDKYGLGLLNSINQGRAAFAAGGFVSASDVPRPSSTAPFGVPLSTGANATMQAGYDAAVAFLNANVESAVSTAAGPAGGGAPGGAWQSIAKIVQAAIPQARINSTYRPGDPGYHGRGKAVDFGFGSGPGGAGSAGLASIARYLYNGFGSTLAELIYDGIGDDTPDVKNGRPHTYNAGTRAEHRNHVHAAVYDRGGLLPSGTAALNLSGSPEMVLNPAQTAAAMRSREFSGSSSWAGGGPVSVAAPMVKVYLDGEEWRGMARVEAMGVTADAFEGLQQNRTYHR